jgi:hypothetical protein
MYLKIWFQVLSKKILCKECRVGQKNTENLNWVLIPQLILGSKHIMNIGQQIITISHLVLPVVSAELQTSISEARHKHTLGNLAILGSYLHNLPSSASKYL